MRPEKRKGPCNGVFSKSLLKAQGLSLVVTFRKCTFFPEFSEGCEDEAWLPHWVMADIHHGKRLYCPLRGCIYTYSMWLWGMTEAKGRKQDNSVPA